MISVIEGSQNMPFLQVVTSCLQCCHYLLLRAIFYADRCGSRWTSVFFYSVPQPRSKWIRVQRWIALPRWGELANQCDPNLLRGTCFQVSKFGFFYHLEHTTKYYNTTIHNTHKHYNKIKEKRWITLNFGLAGILTPSCTGLCHGSNKSSKCFNAFKCLINATTSSFFSYDKTISKCSRFLWLLHYISVLFLF